MSDNENSVKLTDEQIKALLTAFEQMLRDPKKMSAFIEDYARVLDGVGLKDDNDIDNIKEYFFQVRADLQQAVGGTDAWQSIAQAVL